MSRSAQNGSMVMPRGWTARCARGARSRRMQPSGALQQQLRLRDRRQGTPPQRRWRRQRPIDRAHSPRPPRTRTRPTVPSSRDFDARVKEYVALHKKLEDSLPKLPKDATPEQIDSHQRALERLVRQARAGAKPGSIFTPDSREVVRRLMAEVFGGPDGAALKASIMDENPGAIKLTVNGRYPDTVPLSTVPPQVLQGLPKLPEEIEFRFIGRHLILMDVHAHIVVDLIENVAAAIDPSLDMLTRISAAAAILVLALLASGTGTTRSAERAVAGAAPLALTLPNKADSLKFAVLGDFGTGSKEQYELGEQMKRVHDAFPFELVTLVGDNLYGSERPQDFKKKFEMPYKPLLDAGVKFYASLGNHDAREQRYYKLFNMDGKLYYTFKAPSRTSGSSRSRAPTWTRSRSRGSRRS